MTKDEGENNVIWRRALEQNPQHRNQDRLGGSYVCLLSGTYIVNKLQNFFSWLNKVYILDYPCFLIIHALTLPTIRPTLDNREYTEVTLDSRSFSIGTSTVYNKPRHLYVHKKIEVMNDIYLIILNQISFNLFHIKGKGKVIPLQARCGPEGW